MLDKKIVLMQLPSPFLLIEKWTVPLHLFYLKAFLNKKGFKNVILLNLGGVKNYKEAIPADCDFYGISVFTAQFNLAAEVSSYIKKKFKATVIAGGYHISALPEATLRSTDIDIAVIGEGEHTLAEIVSGRPLKEIAGIAYKDNSEVIMNPPRAFHPNIDDFPFPSKEIDLTEYPGLLLDREKNRYDMCLITSRGCPFNCAFCASKKLWKRTVRFHSAEYVIDILKKFHERGVNDFRFEDDNFDLNKERFRKILKFLKEIKSKWYCGMRSANVTEEVISLMKESGLNEISLGIESASNKVLKMINKEETIEEHKRAIKIIKKYGVTIKCFLMSGLPGEDQDAVNETIKFIKEQPVDFFSLQTFVPFPATDIWDDPARFNYLLDKNECSYDKFLLASKNKFTPSVSRERDRVMHHHKLLFDACAERNTVVRAFNVAKNLDKIVQWKQAFK